MISISSSSLALIIAFAIILGGGLVLAAVLGMWSSVWFYSRVHKAFTSEIKDFEDCLAAVKRDVEKNRKSISIHERYHRDQELSERKSTPAASIVTISQLEPVELQPELISDVPPTTEIEDGRPDWRESDSSPDLHSEPIAPREANGVDIDIPAFLRRGHGEGESSHLPARLSGNSSTDAPKPVEKKGNKAKFGG